VTRPYRDVSAIDLDVDLPVLAVMLGVLGVVPEHVVRTRLLHDAIEAGAQIVDADDGEATGILSETPECSL